MKEYLSGAGSPEAGQKIALCGINMFSRVRHWILPLCKMNSV
jgi:hypothetical protein